MNKQLTSQEIKQKIIGKTFHGTHPPHFEYIIAINADGTLEGKNNCHHYDIGKWELDEELHTLTVFWQNGWENTTSTIHNHQGVTQLIDTATGKVNTSLNQKIKAIEKIKGFTF